MMLTMLFFVHALISNTVALSTDDEEIDTKYQRIPYGGFPGFEELKCKSGVEDSRIVDIFASHMKVRKLQQAVVFSCRNSYDKVQTQQRLSEFGSSSIVLDVEDTITENMLMRILPQKYNVAILVDLSCGQQATRILEKCSRLNMMDHHRSWMVVNSNLTDAARVLAVTNLNVDSDVVSVIPGSESDSWISFDAYNQGFNYGGKFNMTFRGIYFLSASNLDREEKDTQSQFNEVAFPESFILNQYHNITKENLVERTEKMLEEVKKYCKTFKRVAKSKQNTIQFGGRTVQYDSGWWIFFTEPWVQRRWKVQNITLINTQVILAKFKGDVDTYVSSQKDVHIETMHRFQYALCLLLCKMIGFRLEHKRAVEWGTIKNGSMTGMIGAIHRQEADLTTTPITTKLNRIGYGEENVVNYVSKLAMIFKQPQSAEVSLKTFTRPLAGPVWWVALAVCGCIVVLHVIAVRSENRVLGASENSVEGSWSYAILSIFSVLYQQGPERSPRLWSGRTVVVSTLLLGFTLYQFYTSSLVSSLLMAPPKQIKNPQDLIDGPFEVGVEEMPYNHVFFEERIYPYVGELYDRKVGCPGRKPAFMSAVEGLQKVRRGGFAFQMDTDLAYKLMEDWSDEEICQVDELIIYPILHLGTRVRSGLPLHQHLLTGYRMIIERGVNARELKTWKTPRPACPPEYATKLQAVGLQLVPAGVALASAAMLSLAVLLFEICFFNISRKRRLRREKLQDHDHSIPFLSTARGNISPALFQI